MLLGEKGAEKLLREHFANEPQILETYASLTNIGMKSDFLRYLLLHVEGGVYTDTDTESIKPIDDWVPSHLRDKARLIVGIEYDQLDDEPYLEMTHSVQFCQWTIAAAAGHPVFLRMIDRVITSLPKLVDKYKKPISEIHPNGPDVLMSTGPGAWTDSVFQLMKENVPTLQSTKDLSRLKEPTLYGDILVLPINGFGMGQPHSGSSRNQGIPDDALMKHNFRGTWREFGFGEN